MGGAKALPVVTISDADLEDNGGQYKLTGKYAVKVNGNDSLSTLGGVPGVVYPVSQDRIASGEFELIQGRAVDVSQVSGRGQESSAWAMPVYHVGSGSWPPSGVTPFVGAYDGIPNLVHVYEPARRTLTSYTGPLVRIRRSSDNVEQDFGYVANGDLDTAAITAFLGGSSGFVVTVYDQVGSNNPTQATAGSQPAYVASGQNGRPVMRFDGTSDWLRVAYSAALSQPFSLYLVAIQTSIAGTRVLLDGDDTANRHLLFTDSTRRISAGTNLSNGTGTTNPELWSTLFNGASSQLWIDGASVASGNAGTQNADGITVCANASVSPSGFVAGDIGSIVIADPSHSTAQREAMQDAINDYWAVY